MNCTRCGVDRLGLMPSRGDLLCETCLELYSLREKLDRVEALLKSWRSCLDHCNADTLDRLEPARELEAALKEPSP